MTVVIAAIGAKALYLLYAWLASESGYRTSGRGSKTSTFWTPSTTRAGVPSAPPTGPSERMQRPAEQS